MTWPRTPRCPGCRNDAGRPRPDVGAPGSPVDAVSCLSDDLGAMRTYIGYRAREGTVVVRAVDVPAGVDVEGPIDLRDRIVAAQGPADRKREPNPANRTGSGRLPGSLTGLARSILTDAVGDVPPEPVAAGFAGDVVPRLPHRRFVLSGAEVHNWLVEQGLFVEAELAAHRCGLPTAVPAPVFDPGATGGRPGDPAAGSALGHPTVGAVVVAAGQVWAEIQRHHPHVPHAVVVLHTGIVHGRPARLGHWWGGRWAAGGEVHGEVLLTGEALELPAGQIFEALLHGGSCRPMVEIARCVSLPPPGAPAPLGWYRLRP